MSAQRRNGLTIVRRFNATPEEMFDAWTDPKIASKWLFTSPTSETNDTALDARPGGQWRITDRRDGVDYMGHGEYLELDRPRRIVFSFGMPQFSEFFDRVTVEIEPAPGGCLMTLTHESPPMDAFEPEDGPWSPPHKDGLKNGWGKMFEALDLLFDKR